MAVRTRGLDIKASAAKLKADRAARAEAELVVNRWNPRLATGRDMLWSPTSGPRCSLERPGSRRDHAPIKTLLVGTKVRFDEHYRPLQVCRGAIGVVAEMEERTAPLGTETWVPARFDDYVTPWIEAWRLDARPIHRDTV